MTSNISCPIHSIETFGTVDGPGIRFVLFTQGCILRCKYCQNRDTWAYWGGVLVTVDQVLEKIDKYKNYIIPSGGGITISGGEPLIHQDFLIELFKKLKEKKYHIAIDTSGMFPITPKIKEIIKNTDLFLLDIKSINNEICQELTGFSNKLELEFAKFLSKCGKHMWIRQVLIPGITDKKEDLINLRNFIKSLKNVDKIEILPYHDLGKFKWEALGLPYPLMHVSTATKKDIERAQRIILE